MRPMSATAAGLIGLAFVMFLVGGLGFTNPQPTRPDDPSIRTDLGSIAPAGGSRSLDATIDALQTRLRSGSPTAAIQGQLGLAYVQKVRLGGHPSYFPKAQRLFRLALAEVDRDIDAFDAIVGSAILANSRHDFHTGLSWARRAVAANPFSSVARGVMTDALIELGRYARASDVLQQMVDLRPDLASFSRISYLRELSGDVAGAIESMRLALRATNEVGENAAWVRSQLGDLYFGSGDIPRAARLYRSASRAAPEYVVPSVGLARVASARGDLQDAIRIMEGVVDSLPSPQHAAFLGDLYSATGRSDEAAAAYRLVRVQKKLLALNGVQPDVELTIFFADHGIRPSRTVALARDQYRDRPSVRTADALAWSLFSAGRSEKALFFARKALRLGTRDALIFFHAGSIAADAGEKALARDHLQTALEINPHFSVLWSEKAATLLRSVS